MKNEELLNSVIEDGLEEIQGMTVGTEEYKSTAETLVKLMDKSIEMRKTDADIQDKIESRIDDNKIKLGQMREDRSDRLVKNILTGAGVVLPIVGAFLGTVITLRYETEDVITTTSGKRWVDALLRIKK